MARAKHTSRAEARRRHRAAQAAALGQPDPYEAMEPAEAAFPEEPRRRSFFSLPDYRTDLAALPGILRSQRSFWLAMGLMLVGFGAALVPLPTGQEQGTGGFVRTMLVQLFLLPQALVPVFIAGFFAPRAAWLLGLLVGLGNVALALLLLAIQPLAVGIPGTELASTVVSYFALTVVTDSILCAFASWYRRFLRQSQMRSRAAREQRAREQRRQNRPGRQPAR